MNQSIVSNVDLEALKGDVECAERGQLKLPSNGTLEVVLSAVQATYDQIPGEAFVFVRSNRSSVIVSKFQQPFNRAGSFQPQRAACTSHVLGKNTDL